MLIRSQDRKRVDNKKMCDLCVSRDRNIEEHYIFGATYSSKEKAMKVMDMIIDHHNHKCEEVFEMPRDSELMYL